MGLLVKGVWQDETPQQQHQTAQPGTGQFRHWVTPDGRPGPSGEAGFTASAGRYHLYVSSACPCSHRVMLIRRLKGLAPMLGLSVLNPIPDQQGWHFRPGRGVIPDPILQAEYLHQLYTRAVPDYSGRVTVPLLWDRERGTIVSNESGDIMQMLNRAFDGLGAREVDFYPAALSNEIDALNARISQGLNGAVYRAGLATTQTDYELAVLEVFETLLELDLRLSEQRYLCAPTPTLADWRLFVSLIRFDAVYAGLFKCNIKPLSAFTQLAAYLRDLYQYPGVSETVDLQACKLYYYKAHPQLNPGGIVPMGPSLDLSAAHDRARFD